MSSCTSRNWKEPEKLSLFDEIGKELKLKFTSEEEKNKWLEAFIEAGLGKTSIHKSHVKEEEKQGMKLIGSLIEQSSSSILSLANKDSNVRKNIDLMKEIQNLNSLV